MGAGRPTKYTNEIANRLYETMAQGDSITQFAVFEGIDRSTVYEWANKHPEFSDALMRGKQAGEAYWERELQHMMYNKDVNAPLVKLYFANRFDWHDRSAVDHTSSDQSMTPQASAEAVEEALRRKHSDDG